MAQKRMLSRRLTESDKIQALKGNDLARFMYVALLPLTDKAGRVNVNPYGLKGTIFEPFEYTVEQIEGAVRALGQVGLLTLYSTPKHQMLAEYPKFEEFNKPHPNEAESDLPGPKDATSTLIVVSGSFPEDSRKLEPAGSSYTLTPTPSLSIEEDASIEKSPRDDLEDFAAAWNDNRGPLPAIEGLSGKRKAALRRLVKEHGREEALALLVDATRAVAANEFYIQKRYGFDVLVPSKVLKYAEQWRADGGVMSSANAKLATTVAGWARALEEVN